MPAFRHTVDVRFSVLSDEVNFDNVPRDQMIAALKARIKNLEDNPSEAIEAFGHIESTVE